MQMNPFNTFGVTLSFSGYPSASWIGTYTFRVNNVEIDKRDESAEDMTDADTAPSPKYAITG